MSNFLSAQTSSPTNTVAHAFSTLARYMFGAEGTDSSNAIAKTIKYEKPAVHVPKFADLLSYNNDIYWQNQSRCPYDAEMLFGITVKKPRGELYYEITDCYMSGMDEENFPFPESICKIDMSHWELSTWCYRNQMAYMYYICPTPILELEHIRNMSSYILERYHSIHPDSKGMIIANVFNSTISALLEQMSDKQEGAISICQNRTATPTPTPTMPAVAPPLFIGEVMASVAGGSFLFIFATSFCIVGAKQARKKLWQRRLRERSHQATKLHQVIDDKEIRKFSELAAIWNRPYSEAYPSLSNDVKDYILKFLTYDDKEAIRSVELVGLWKRPFSNERPSLSNDVKDYILKFLIDEKKEKSVLSFEQLQALRVTSRMNYNKLYWGIEEAYANQLRKYQNPHYDHRKKFIQSITLGSLKALLHTGLITTSAGGVYSFTYFMINRAVLYGPDPFKIIGSIVMLVVSPLIEAFLLFAVKESFTIHKNLEQAIELLPLRPTRPHEIERFPNTESIKISSSRNSVFAQRPAQAVAIDTEHTPLLQVDHTTLPHLVIG